MQPKLFIIAGPNGAGKTTFAREFLPNYAHCKEFVNADMIATGLSPFEPRMAALRAGRLMLERIEQLTAGRISFAFETTLSGKGYLPLFHRMKTMGYHIDLFYMWLPNEGLAVRRVQDRVRQGGHNIPAEDIRRRFKRGLQNLFHMYQPVLDTWTIWDNSGKKPEMIAKREADKLQVFLPDAFATIQRIAEVS